MKKTMILETLAAALFATAQVQAAPISLDNAVITATYQGSGDNILGLDKNFAGGQGGNVSAVYDPGAGVEFITAYPDSLFAIDFSNTGLVSVYDNNPVTPPAAGAPGYTLTFDFGTTLPAAISSFTLVDASAINGVPVLTVLNDHTIGLDLSQVTWNGDFVAFTAQIGAADAAGGDVPEPASLALLLSGACGLAASRKRKRA